MECSILYTCTQNCKIQCWRVVFRTVQSARACTYVWTLDSEYQQIFLIGLPCACMCSNFQAPLAVKAQKKHIRGSLDITTIGLCWCTRGYWGVAQIQGLGFFSDKILLCKYKHLWIHEGANFCFFLNSEL